MMDNVCLVDQLECNIQLNLKLCFLSTIGFIDFPLNRLISKMSLKDSGYDLFGEPGGVLIACTTHEHTYCIQPE